MTRRSRIAFIVASVIAAAVLVLAAWWGASRMRSPGPGGPGEPAAQRALDSEPSGPRASSHARSAQLPPGTPHRDGEVTIAGHVIDISLLRGCAGSHRGQQDTRP